MSANQVRNQTFRIKLFLSYALIFILPLLLMGAIAFQWLSSITLNQTIDLYQNSLRSAREYSDKQFADLKKLSLQLSQTGWVKKYMVRDFSVYQEEQLDLKKHNEELLVYNAANDFIDDIAIYFHNRGNVLSSMGINDFTYFFSDNFNVMGINHEKWQDILDQNNQAVMLYTDKVSTYGNIRSGIIYLQSYPMDLNSDFRASLLIFINKKNVQKAVSSLFPDSDAHVCILNEQNEPIVDGNIDAVAFEKIQEIIVSGKEGNGISQTLITDTVNLIFLEKSQTTGWVFAALIPRASIMHDVRKIQTIIVLLVLLSSITGLFVSYVLTNHSYRPVEGILKVLGVKTKARENEFDLIKNEIMELVNHDTKLKERMELNKPTLVDAYLSKLLSRSENDKDEIIKILEWFDICFDYPMNCCLIVRQHETAASCQLTNDIADFRCKTGLKVYPAGNDNEMALICTYSDVIHLNEYIDDIFSHFKESGAHISIGVGKGYNDFHELCLSYSEAKEALDYHLIKEEKCSILYYETINRHWYYYYPADTEASLMQNLRSGDYKKAMSIFEQMLEQNMKGDHINMVIIRYFFFYSLMSAYSICNELEIEGISRDDSEIVLKCQDINEMKSCIQNLYSRICDHVNMEKKSHNTKLKDEIFEYIETNLSNESMTLASTADEFGISSSYLSRFFKEQFGCNFLDYIHRKRIIIAKKLLESCDRPIVDIMASLGYNNAVTFRRLFHKYEGVSPGQYRNKVYKIK